MQRIAVLFLSAFFLVGCNKVRSLVDDNAKPKFGKRGLPVNCRAYVQASIDGYRYGRFTAKAALNGLERNCGRYGAAWIDNRK